MYAQDLPKAVLFNPAVPDTHALATPFRPRGMRSAKLFPIKIVGSGLPIKFFYYNMRLHGQGKEADPTASIPWILACEIASVAIETATTLGGRMASLFHLSFPTKPHPPPITIVDAMAAEYATEPSLAL